MDVTPLRRHLPSRQVLLFLVAIGLPCVVLVGLSLRMLAQERELADKRLADTRRVMAADVRQELLSRLERLRREALATPAGSRTRLGAQHEPVALVGAVEGDRLILPWDGQTETSLVAAALAEPVFAAAIGAGERRELVDRQFEAALADYRRAGGQARLPAQKAYAALLAARALAKAGRFAAADALNRDLLESTRGLVDEHGVPFALYAARRLLDSKAGGIADRDAALTAVRDGCRPQTTRVPAAIYMCSDLAAALGAPTFVQQMAAVRADLEQALSLQRGFSTVLAQMRAAAGGGTDSPWIRFGQGDTAWMVGVEPAIPDSPVVAVRTGHVLASLNSVRSAQARMEAGTLLGVRLDGAGEPIGTNVPGLVLAFDPPGSAPTGVQRSFYLAALALVVSMTMFGGYLFWRDVKREVRLAEMRTQFVSSVSHELKTPLTAIRMFAETLLLGRSSRPDVRDEYLNTIVNESERLTRLLNNVLDFSRIEQGRKTYRMERQPLGHIIRTAARAMEYPFSQQGFELRLEVDEALPPVAADPDAIQQVVLNLLSNAMKYSGDGRAIDLRLTREPGHAVISVTDRGLGIPPAEQTRIFDKFYRIAGADRDRIPGTGLGLTLVDHIVKAHGGSVGVVSAPGQGSTFAIRIPLAQPDVAI